MPPLELNQLSRRERQIMNILFEREACSAQDVQKAMPEPPSYSTVRALLARLVEKKVIRFRKSGVKYIYFALEEEEAVKKSALGSLLKTFFRSSKAQAVNALLDFEGESLSDSEIDELERTIKRIKKARAHDAN